MYECISCGYRFEEPKDHYEPREYWGGIAYERVSGCPACDGAYAAYKEADNDEEDF